MSSTGNAFSMCNSHKRDIRITRTLCVDDRDKSLCVLRKCGNNVSYLEFWIPKVALKTLNAFDNHQSQKDFLIKILESCDHSYKNDRCLITFDRFEHLDVYDNENKPFTFSAKEL